MKIPTFTGVWKKLIPALLDNFEGFRTSVEGVTARELEVGPEDVTGLLQSLDKTLMDKELLLMNEQESHFLGWNLFLMKML